jgi:hypothetical protein
MISHPIFQTLDTFVDSVWTVTTYPLASCSSFWCSMVDVMTWEGRTTCTYNGRRGSSFLRYPVWLTPLHKCSAIDFFLAGWDSHVWVWSADGDGFTIVHVLATGAAPWWCIGKSAYAARSTTTGGAMDNGQGTLRTSRKALDGWSTKNDQDCAKIT